MFKIGQTSQQAWQRIDTLNAELERVREIGRFQLEHSVAVPDAYGAEQAVFALLEECRIALSKEFFLGSVEMLRDAINCIATGVGEAVFREQWADELSAAFERRRQVTGSPWEHPPELTGDTTGWVIVLRNDWHADDIYRIGHTQRDPLEVVRRLYRRRRASATVGFYRPVLTVPVRNAPATARAVLAELRAKRVDARSQLVQDMPLEDLKRVIRDCAARAIPGEQRSMSTGLRRASTPRRAPTGPLFVGEKSNTDSLTEAKGPARRFTCPYSICQATLIVYGAPNTTDTTRCSSCRRIVHYEIDGAGAATPSKDTLDWRRRP